MYATSKSVFGYSPMMEGETGIYVICNDKGILDNVNSFMRDKGIVGIMDTAGRLHYMVDARRSANYAAEKVTQIAQERVVNKASLNETESFNELVLQTMRENGFDMTLVGSFIICEMVQSIKLVSTTNLSMKILYSRVASHLKMTYSQMERDVRYSIRKSKLGESKMRTISLILMLYQETCKKIPPS